MGHTGRGLSTLLITLAACFFFLLHTAAAAWWVLLHAICPALGHTTSSKDCALNSDPLVNVKCNHKTLTILNAASVGGFSQCDRSSTAQRIVGLNSPK